MHKRAWREAASDLPTKDQAEVVDLLSGRNRVEITRGAGAGKSRLAVERARRLAAEG